MYLWVYFEGEETTTTADPEDMLDRQKCLDALAAIRRVKWFHVCVCILYLDYRCSLLTMLIYLC